MKIKLKNIPVLYINLDRDIDRRDMMESMLSKMKFKTIHRIPGVIANIDHDCFSAHPEAYSPGYCMQQKYYGCAMAHKSALEFANSKYPNKPVIILEDDCFLVNPVKSFKIPDNSDAVYLGIGNGGMANVTSGDIDNEKKALWKNTNPEFILDKTMSRILNMGSAHAIMYMNNSYRNLAIQMCDLAIKHSTLSDTLFTTLQPYNFVYALNSPVFAQNGLFLTQTDTTLDIIKHAIDLGVNSHV